PDQRSGRSRKQSRRKKRISGKLPRPKARNPKISKSRLAPKSDRLLGICFWREGFETAFGPERRGEKED
ncbi:MAG: hypothetical protein QNL33_16725, partial [Akkermansiaceae bacterium]